MQASGRPGGLSVVVLSVPFMEHSGHRLDNSCHSSHHRHFTSLREGCKPDLAMWAVTVFTRTRTHVGPC